jgi:hypothetical protein
MNLKIVLLMLVYTLEVTELILKTVLLMLVKVALEKVNMEKEVVNNAFY